jgi:DNA-binding MarR family transcriptional regulator
MKEHWKRGTRLEGNGGRAPAMVKDETAALEAASHRQLLDTAVDRLVEEWAMVVPGMDRDVRAIAARIARIDERIRAHAAHVLKQAQLSDNEFRLLAGLLRSGPPYRCPPTDLAGRYVPVTSGALTGLARRLEERGLINRTLHPRDNRSVLLNLTETGKQLALETMERFAQTERSLMASLTAADRATGNRFLRKLLHSIEKTYPTP